MYLERLEAALPEVRSRIDRACERSNRQDSGAVVTVGVTKGHTIEALKAAREAGLGVVGENRVQEAAEKLELVGRLGLEWHMIGHLQRNKVKAALKVFSLIHSVDSLRLAREIAKEASRSERQMPVLVQIDASGEATKFGIGASEGSRAVKEICEIDGIEVIGLMTMAPLTEDEGILRNVFKRTCALFERCGQEIEKFEPRYLSMGMTNDYELAIEEGSNMVRLGTALFGERT